MSWGGSSGRRRAAPRHPPGAVISVPDLHSRKADLARTAALTDGSDKDRLAVRRHRSPWVLPMNVTRERTGKTSGPPGRQPIAGHACRRWTGLAARSIHLRETAVTADFAGKTALITGSGRGIGRAVALGLGDAGARVILLARTAGQLGETRVLLRERGVPAERISVVPADLSDEGDRGRAAVAMLAAGRGGLLGQQ